MAQSLTSASQTSTVVNAMTVDVEDYFQVSAFENHIRREDWGRKDCRVEGNMERILSLFSETGIKGTFFVLGWIAERYPQMISGLVDHGHELASHGWSHVRVFEQNPKQFREDVIRTKRLLEDVSGKQVRGYRAASYSIGADNLWALDILKEAGHQYSSSIYPIRHDLYGMPEAPRFPFHPGGDGFLEVPVTTVKVMGRNYPCGGGGYFRLFPYRLSRWALRRVNSADKQACVFYFHPWEIDPDQPRQAGISLKTRVRHYLNLGKMEPRLRRLMRDFKWARMDQVFLNKRDAPG